MQLEPHNPRRALSPPDEASDLLYHLQQVTSGKEEGSERQDSEIQKKNYENSRGMR